MKICIIGSSKYLFSGISAYTIVMANAFAQQGDQPSVVLLRKLVPLFLYPGKKDHVNRNDFIIDFIPNVRIYDGMDWYSPYSWFGVWNFLKREKPDAVIIHWWTSSVAHMQIIVSLFSRWIDKKTIIIMEMHEVVDTLEEKILPIRLYSRLIGNLLMKLCDLFVAHSNDARSDILNTYHIEQNKIFVIPHGPYSFYNTTDRRDAQKELGLDGFTILYFGTIREYKGVPLLIEAFNKLPEEVAELSHLLIVGENWLGDKSIEHLLDSSTYKSRIHYNPIFIPDILVSKYFSVADVVVLPYMRSSGSGVASIAAAQGKRTIMSNIPTLKENFEKYDGASFFPVGNVAKLTDQLLKTYIQWKNEGPKYYNYISNDWSYITNTYRSLITGFKRANMRGQGK